MTKYISIYQTTKNFHLKSTGLIFFSVFIAFSEFFTYVSSAFYVPVFFVLFLFFLSIMYKPVVKYHVIIYMSILSFLVCILFLRKTTFNGLLVIPIFSYVVYVVSLKVFNDKDIKESYNYFLKFAIILLIFISAFEVLTKLNVVDFSYYSDFIRNYGDKRFDVLRTRVLWGSSLSSAAVGVFFAFYFSLVKKDFLFLGLTFFYLMLTGSRTGIVLFMLFVFISLFKGRDFWKPTLSKKTLFNFMLLLPIFIVAFLWLLSSDISSIILRSFTFKADASFVGRGSTTGDVLVRLFSTLSESLLWGIIDGKWISDSAFTSIAAGSSLLLLLLFIGYLYALLFNTTLSVITKLTFILATILGGWTIGDFFIPAVTFLYFLTFLIYEKSNTHNNRLK